MTDTVAVTVTRKHIKKGKPNEPTGCPIALAIREVTGYKYSVLLDTASRLDSGVPVYGSHLALSRAATTFIRHYDAGIKVRPANFRFRKVTV